MNDGYIGNKAMAIALSCLTTGNLNTKIKQGSTPYTMKDVLPSIYEYIIPPASDEDKKENVRNQLLSFMLSRPEANKYLKE